MSIKKLTQQLNRKNPKLRRSECRFIVDIFIETVLNSLKQEKNIEIRGLGHWYWKKLRENYNARNPLTNELIYRPERVKLKFKASKKLNKIINE